MSVTFSCLDAPRRTIPCPFCKDVVSRGYDIEGKCIESCDGTERESEAPEVNFSNVNARSVLILLGLDTDDLCGSVEGLADFRQRIMRARNGDRSSALREWEDLPAGHAGTAIVTDDDGMSRIERRGPRMIMAGNTDEQTLRRLASLDTLASWAQEHHLTISWG